MFTGIVREVGRVRDRKGSKLRIDCSLEPGLGDSVAVNGACLTVVKRHEGALWFDVSEETYAKTALGGLAAGDPVNLEPALKLGEELGGHLVSGHVDCTAAIVRLKRTEDGFATLRVELPKALRGLAAEKGSICVDGISLTVSDLGKKWFEAALVPHTMERTNLSGRKPGDVVNLEADMLARYVKAILKNG
jgi:riboflavin synthase